MASPNKVSPSDCDNDRQSEMANVATKTGNTYISGTMTDNSNGKSGVFDYGQHEETDPGRLRQPPTTGNGDMDVLLANIAISGSRLLSQSFV